MVVKLRLDGSLQGWTNGPRKAVSNQDRKTGGSASYVLILQTFEPRCRGSVKKASGVVPTDFESKILNHTSSIFQELRPPWRARASTKSDALKFYFRYEVESRCQ